MKLPTLSGPIGAMYKWFFLDLVNPEDDFPQVLRKLTICVLAMLAPRPRVHLLLRLPVGH